MVELDETDVAILRLLSQDSRRSYNEMASEVDLSPPAVSDRINRLRERDIIRRFTIDVNQEMVGSGINVFLEFDVVPGKIEILREQIEANDSVTEFFVTADSHLYAFGQVPDGSTHKWINEMFDVDAIQDIQVRIVTESERTPTVGGMEFPLTCAQCGDFIATDGIKDLVDGDVYTFCGPACKERYAYQRDQSSSDPN
jgi:DNA-binding Lrp family transcriptional regulator